MYFHTFYRTTLSDGRGSPRDDTQENNEDGAGPIEAVHVCCPESKARAHDLKIIFIGDLPWQHTPVA